jgi:hypothetical protein
MMHPSRLLPVIILALLLTPLAQAREIGRAVS